MSDRLKRLICRSVFFCCCLFPTLLVTKWVLFPKTVDDWNLELRSQLGVKVSVEHFETPTPQVTLLKNVSFEHNNRACLELAQVKTASVQGQRLISLSHTQLSIDDLRNLLTEMIATVNQNTPDDPTQIKINNLDIFESPASDDSRRLSLREVTIDLKQSPASTTALIKSTPAGQEHEITLRVALDTTADVPKFDWEMDTDGFTVDAWVLQSFYPWLKHCGDTCQFAGTIKATYLDNNLKSADIRGTLANINGETLLNKQFNIGFEGMTDLRIDRCEMIDGRIEKMAGRVVCNKGSFDTRLSNKS